MSADSKQILQSSGQAKTAALFRNDIHHAILRLSMGLIALLSYPADCVFAQTKPDTASGRGAFATGVYRNLFRENGHSEVEVELKVQTAFRRLFYGDTLTPGLYKRSGRNQHGDLAYIHDVWNNDIRSEGMSYGMMIAVQLNKRSEFDALWNYALSHMYIDKPGHPANGYFAWSLKNDGSLNSDGPAPDGEEYFVTALYMASARWGSKKGIYNYRRWADTILTNMRHHPLLHGPVRSGSATVGSVLNEEKKIILFVPKNQGDEYSDPSYHLPAFYELWARCGPVGERAFWSAAADSSRRYFWKAAHPLTGLAPDYADFNGAPVKTNFNANSHHFAYDSWRTAMNWSVDWSWWQRDRHEQELSDRIQVFFHREGIRSYGSIYSIEGSSLGGGHASGLVATNAVASLASTTPMAKEFVESLWLLPVPKGKGERYYSGLLYLIGLLHCSGQFKAYIPQ